MNCREHEIVEICPYCDCEVIMIWNVKEDGFKAFCPHCGNRLMLCDECQHRHDGECRDDCDYNSKTDSCRFNPEEKENICAYPYKKTSVYKNKDMMDVVCYIPENAETKDDMYTHNDLLKLVGGDEKLCDQLFDQLNWAFPSTYIDENIMECEWTRCACGKLFSGKICPDCGRIDDDDYSSIQSDVLRILSLCFTNEAIVKMDEDFLCKIVDNVVETSSYGSDGNWNDDDIRLAIARNISLSF